MAPTRASPGPPRFYEKAISVKGKVRVFKPMLPPKSRCRPTGGRNARFCIELPNAKELPFLHPSVLVLAGRWSLSRPRRLRRRAVVTGTTSPLTIAAGGMGADLRRSRAVSGSCWPFLLIGLSLPGTACLPLAPLLSALDPACRPAARWGPSFRWGAAISAAVSIGPRRGTQSAP